MKKFEELEQSIKDKVYDLYKRYMSYRGAYEWSSDEAVEEWNCEEMVKAEDEIVDLLNKAFSENKECLFEFDGVEKELYKIWLKDPDYYRFSY